MSTSAETLASLTDAQRQAVQHLDGPLLILAGPGSGKTRVVTHRIAHLIHQGVHPRSILALTFTNKAADEMNQRVRRLTSGDDVWMGTFHRFCARLLRRYAEPVGLNPNFTIYDTSDSLAALKVVMKRLDLDLMMTAPERLARRISWAKNNLITAEEYESPIGDEYGSIMQEVYPAYQQQLLSANAVDFDDLLLHVATLLRQSDELRRSLDDAYQYVLVDEYQDTNLAQYAIVRSISVVHPNLAVTGDPDQSIYGWRGANLRNILDFESDYPNVKIVRLEENYRSTPSILRVADALIVNNVQRKHKALFTNNSDGPPVRLTEFPTQKEEAEEIVAYIAKQKRLGERRLQDFAILYRINALSRPFEHALRENSIAYQIVNGVEFYQRKEIKDALAYLHLINNPSDDVAFSRIINVPARRIGKVTVQRLAAFASRQRIALLEAASRCDEIASISKTIRGRVQKFAEFIHRLSSENRSVEELLGLIMTDTGYLEKLQASDLPEDTERAANLGELLTAAREFEEQYGQEGSLEAFLEQASLVNDTDAFDQEMDRVTLMTLHSAKGLEFPVIFIVGIEQNLLPHERSRGAPEQREEERRLFFVGITRAKHELHLSLAKVRALRGGLSRTVPSEFLMELPRAEMEIVERSGYLSYTSYEVSEHEIHSRTQHVNSTAQIRTAAEMARGDSSITPSPAGTNSDPDRFKVGMTVIHPEYGPGKVAALTGQGRNRTGTINFPTAGQKKFILANATLRLRDEG